MSLEGHNEEESSAKETERKYEFFVNYKAETLTENVMVKISSCMSCVAFSDKDEKYLLEMDGEWSESNYSQRLLDHLSNLNIYYIKEPPGHERGFYFIASQDYD